MDLNNSDRVYELGVKNLKKSAISSKNKKLILPWLTISSLVA